MGAGHAAPSATLHRRDHRRPVSGGRRLAGGSGADAELSGNVSNPDRCDRAAARRGYSRGRLRRRIARPAAGAAPRFRQPDHRGDVNPFLLREAAQLAEADGLAGLIQFRQANVEALPFADASYDCVYSVTVFEECDAGRAVAETLRVVRPGGRVGLVVRALDMRQWWNLALPEAILRKVEAPPHSVAPLGVADRSLYRRMREAGFVDLVCFPSMVTLDRHGGPIWRNREDHILSLLSPDELAVW